MFELLRRCYARLIVQLLKIGALLHFTFAVAGIVFAIFAAMKHLPKLCAVAAGVLVTCSLTILLPCSVTAQKKVVDQIADAVQPPTSPADKETIRRFEQRVKQYMKLRESIRGRGLKLSKDSTPEQIQAAETAFLEALRSARARAKPGDVFAPDIAQYIRATLKREFKPAEKKEIRKVVLDTETNIPVPLKVNYPYPDPREFVEMPPTLLLKLPQLPKQVKYRYVGHSLMLVDTDYNLIIDFMLDALP